MLKAGRVVAVLMSLYMAFGLIWTGARDPYMGVDVELYGVGARPSTMVGKAWPASKMEEWSREFDVDVLVAGTPKRAGVIAGYPASQNSEFATWLKNGYPCLNSCVAKPLNLKDHPGDIRDFETEVAGLYFMGGRSKEAAATASAYFKSRGWSTGFEELDSRQNWITDFQDLFGRLMLVSSAIVLLLVGGCVLTRSHSVGVLLLQGSSRLGLVLVDLLTWVKLMLSGAVFGLVGMFLLFRVAFGGHQFGRVVLAFTPIWAALTIVGALGIFFAHGILSRSSILGMVKGETRFGATFPIVYLLRTFLILAMVSLLMALMSSVSDYQEQRQVEAHLGAMKTLSLLQFNAGVGDDVEHQGSAVPEFTRLLSSGEFIVNQATPAYYLDTSDSITDQLGNGQESLVIEASSGFFKMNSFTMLNGRPVDFSRDIVRDNMTLLVPAGTNPKIFDIVSGYVKNVVHSNGAIPGMKPGVAPHVVLVKRSDRYYNTYGRGISRVKNPIIIVYPNTFRPSQDYVTSLQGLFVESRRQAEVLASAPNFASLISDSRPAAKVVSESVASKQGKMDQGLIELLDLLLVLPLCTLAAVFLYVRQNSKRVFIQTTSGHRLVDIAPMLIVVDVITAAALCWYSWPKGAVLDDLHKYGELALMAPKVQFAFVIMVFLLVVLLQYGLLDRLRWGIVRHHAAEE